MGKKANGEGSIRKRADGRWEGRYTVQTATGAKRKAVYGKTRKEVAAKLAKALAEREAGLVFDAGDQTVAEYLDGWLEDAKGSIKRRTFESYLVIVRRHLVPAIGRVKLAALSPTHIRGLYRAKRDDDLSPKTVANIHMTLHRALTVAVRLQLVPRNACVAVAVPKRHSPNIRPLDQQQARTLLKAAQGDDLEAFYVLALTTGARLGELLGLCWEDVDLERATLHIRQTLVTGVGGQTFGTPKTAKGRRCVALTPGAMKALKGHRGRSGAADGLIFRSCNGTPLNPSNVRTRSFKPLLRKAGLPTIYGGF